jgi:hypothetical protein
MVIRNKCCNTFTIDFVFENCFLFFLSDILFTSCYFTCLVLEISLFGSIAVNIVEKVFHIWHSDPYMDRLRPSRLTSLHKVSWWSRNNFRIQSRSWRYCNDGDWIFWHRCLERQTLGTPRMYTLSPSKNIKESNYREFLKDKNALLMYTTVLSLTAYKYVPNLESLLTQQPLYFSKERVYTSEGYPMFAFLSIDVKRSNRRQYYK